MSLLRRHRCTALRLLVPALGALLAGCSGSKAAGYQGYVEGEYVNVASPVAGRLDRLLVQRGQMVDAKAPLFSLESEQEVAAKQQADEQFNSAQAQLADLKVGRRRPEVAVTQAQLAQARAALAQATLQLQRDEAQFDAGGIARGQVEDARANQAIKAARVRELEGLLDVNRLPARDDQIRAQSAQVAAARAVQSQAAWRLDQKRPAAGQQALVSDTLYREGEWVPAGSPVVRLLPPGNVKLRFFVPEPAAGDLRPGRSVNVGCDGCGTGLSAVVSYVANEAEYTPPVIYSNETRAKLVFLVEARPTPESAARLRPGQPVSVTLP
ncbi:MULTISPECIES: HlyD family secretion protein [Ramlibacter]|uniref:HlyD family efflux transporter periplasmic adaptor subunit n=1 Tax=Ramlibacter pinisoli TaxID=2682844 RepID=A0A6N8INS2_9BURK|nr:MULTISPECIES: HlyD family efflux transporter periplasmic adaptor subunit [Ramlibacter]MBA2960545.1 HlyD family efflux transporter periplasmic adaptor subunit [Ramlibacter sp. CGMCC 1.13660]MVQ27876.1 HlyD family efflux transporter periplasmic adaptor subunit [Ramlibacter pinisoli]